MKVVRGKGGDHHLGEQEHDQDRDGWGERGRTELGGKEGWPKGDEIYDLDLCPRAIRLRRLGDDRGRRSGVGLTLAVTRRLRKLLGPRSPTNPSHNVPSCLEPLLLLPPPASPSRSPWTKARTHLASSASTAQTSVALMPPSSIHRPQKCPPRPTTRTSPRPALGSVDASCLPPAPSSPPSPSSLSSSSTTHSQSSRSRHQN